MSDLACGRNQCPNVMCDRLILDNSRYICETCWGELLHYRSLWPEVMTELQVYDNIRSFMATVPGTYISLTRNGNGDEIETAFRKWTGQDWQ